MGVALHNDDLLARAKADDEFHRLLVLSCGNSRIARIGETIMDQSHRARMLTLKLRPKPAGGSLCGFPDLSRAQVCKAEWLAISCKRRLKN
jgi:DNA-binding GntR family transcriptional regulator